MRITYIHCCFATVFSVESLELFRVEIPIKKKIKKVVRLDLSWTTIVQLQTMPSHYSSLFLSTFRRLTMNKRQALIAAALVTVCAATAGTASAAA